MEFLDEQPLEGGFNTNHFISSDKESVGLVRVSKENNDLLENILFEFQVIGFIGDGGRVRKRTIDEQADFSIRARNAGLRVLGSHEDESNMVMPYIHNLKTLDVYMDDLDTSDDSKRVTIHKVVEDLENAHRKGFVYGDRWSGNIAVLPGGDPINIDFDIELSGRFAREADLAQALFHILRVDKDELATGLLTGTLARGFVEYDFMRLTSYLNGFSEFFVGTHIGGSEEKVAGVVEHASIARGTKNYGAIMLNR